MMQEEGLIEKAGDILPEFFGIKNVKIAGILAPTNTFLDEIHLVSTDMYAAIDAKENIYLTQTPL